MYISSDYYDSVNKNGGIMSYVWKNVKGSTTSDYNAAGNGQKSGFTNYQTTSYSHNNGYVQQQNRQQNNQQNSSQNRSRNQG